MVPRDGFSHRTWRGKFRVAFRGVAVGFQSQPSFLLQLPAALFAVVVAAWLQVELWKWVALVGCIGAVLSMEMLNTGLECLSRAVTRDENEWVRDALDIASGAVLLAAATAAVIGLMILAPDVWMKLAG